MPRITDERLKILKKAIPEQGVFYREAAAEELLDALIAERAAFQEQAEIAQGFGEAALEAQRDLATERKVSEWLADAAVEAARDETISHIIPYGDREIPWPDYDDDDDETGDSITARREFTLRILAAAREAVTKEC